MTKSFNFIFGDDS